MITNALKSMKLFVT
jgi:hypothetical protein